jgi:hypothetical protein
MSKVVSFVMDSGRKWAIGVICQEIKQNGPVSPVYFPKIVDI